MLTASRRSAADTTVRTSGPTDAVGEDDKLLEALDKAEPG
jgi:hypothetical protein